MPADRRLRPIVLVSDATGFGGAEVYLATLVAELAHDREFLAVVGDEAGEETVRRLTAAGARVAQIPGLGRVPRASAVRRLAATLRAVDPAVVHVNATDQGDGLAAILAAQAVRKPLVVTVHLALGDRTRRHEALSARALSRADAVIAVAPAIARHLRGLSVDCTLVRNGRPVPCADAAPATRTTIGVAQDAVLVGGIGRLSEQKGWDVLCRAAPRIRELCPNAAIVIVGDGPERTQLEILAERYGVRLLGAHADATAILCAFDVLAAPSRFEGLPLVPIEALHAGVPIVGTEIEGLRDVVGTAGVLVAADDPSALGAALGALAADPARRAQLAQRGRARAAELFTAQRMASETLAVYERVAERAVPPAPSVTIPA